MLDHNKSNIMPCPGVFPAGIAQPHNQVELRWQILIALLLLLFASRFAGSSGSRGFLAGFLGTFGRGFVPRFGSALLRALGRFGSFFAFLLFLDHLYFARSTGGSSGVGSLFFLCARRCHSDDRDILITKDFHSRGRLDFADMNGLTDVQIAYIHRDEFW